MLDLHQIFLGVLLRAFVPVALLLLAAVLAAYLYHRSRQNRLAAAGMPEVDRMTGADFESKIALVFGRQGYQVQQTPSAGDWGADLVISRAGLRTAVQVKRWNRPVSPRAIQEAVAAKAKYACEHAMVVTNSSFTASAVELARANGVELWDRSRLAKELLSIAGSDAHPVAPPGLAANAAPTLMSPTTVPAPRCFKCGREMVLKENARGKFWACPGFPKCRNTFPARA